MTQTELLLQVALLLEMKKPWADISTCDMLKVIMYVHSKGWLYTAVDEDGVLELVGVAYRVPEYKESEMYKLPKEESGNTLYIPFMVSVSNDRMKVLRSLRQLLNMVPEAEKLVFERRSKDGVVRQYNKEKHHGWRQQTRSPECAGISG